MRTINDLNGSLVLILFNKNNHKNVHSLSDLLVNIAENYNS